MPNQSQQAGDGYVWVNDPRVKGGKYRRRIKKGLKVAAAVGLGGAAAVGGLALARQLRGGRQKLLGGQRSLPGS